MHFLHVNGVKKPVPFYSLDVIISVGYRVHSKRGTLFDYYGGILFNYYLHALVRANYKNAVKGIDYSPQYLERFFRNLLLGEKWDLRNRYLHIHPTAEWKE
ncbi:RhuM family protein [Prevotella aff. ruminicola Tc2-24]|uniref:RhuM family protein n=1 Tax=Prevotella aff. ruminicola Tc2-24 TaxID=81582 RepID=UPI000AD3ED4C|nr:RhuM family protein [Prevotella aff. ruminicola Tc2-24]